MSFYINLQHYYPDTKVFPESPYFDGRWSNGPTYIEVAAQKLQRTLYNYGVGSATTGAVDVEGYGHISFAAGEFGPYQTTVQLPSMIQQAHQYISSGAPSQDSLFLLYAGSNDLAAITLGLSKAAPFEMVNAYRQTIDLLYKAGARNFVLANQPASTCCLADAEVKPKMKLIYNLITDEFNTALSLLRGQLDILYPGTTFKLFDAKAAWERARTATDQGIEISEIACYPSPRDGFAEATECKDPELFFHWDLSHPSKHAHELIADSFIADLQQPDDWPTLWL